MAEEEKGVICTITWKEEDIAKALNERLKREPTAEELEQACDTVYAFRETLLDSSIEKGWEVIDMILNGEFS